MVLGNCYNMSMANHSYLLGILEIMRSVNFILTALSTVAMAEHPLSIIDNDHVVAATLILEAGGESDPRAMAAVYEVITNRAERSGMTSRRVVLRRKQFSCWNENVLTRYEIATQHSRFNEALKIVQSPPTNYTAGATHYHAMRITPYWASSYTPTITIENHKFYK